MKQFKLHSSETLAIAILVESVYWLGTRLVLQYFAWDTFTAESIRTILRLGSVAIIFWLYRDLVLSRRVDVRECKQPVFLGCLILLMGVPFFLKHHSMSLGFSLFFGVTAIAVGIKEEILFRGVIQNYLMKELGVVQSVLIASLLFSAWHFGVGPNTLLDYAHIFLAGTILGVIYVRTGSILLVIAIHTFYDMMFSLPNYFAASENIAFSLLLCSLGLACLGAKPSKLKIDC